MNIRAFFVLFCLSAASVFARPFGTEGGVAVADITLPAGYRMAGYFYERISTGVHDPLLAKALALRRGDREFVFVFCDLIGIPAQVSGPARAKAAALLGISSADILVCATHSHTGPLFSDVRRDVFHDLAVAKHGHDPQEAVDYPRFLYKQLVAAITNAHARLAPVRLETGVAEQKGLSFNRRYSMNDGRIVTNPGRLNPNVVGPVGPVDNEAGLIVVRNDPAASSGGLRAKGAEELGRGVRPGALLAVMTVFALHPDTAGGREFGGDYPFYLQETLRRKLDRNVVSLFGLGTCGDINHVNVFREPAAQGQAESRRIGNELAWTVCAALPGLRPVAAPSFASRSETLTAPLQPVSAAEADAAMETIRRTAGGKVPVEAVKAADIHRRGREITLEVQVFRLDAETAVVGLPGEIFVELGLAIKQASPFRQTLVMSLCNDRPGYIPTEKAFREGGYETVNSRVVPGTGERLVETAVRLLMELKP